MNSLKLDIDDPKVVEETLTPGRDEGLSLSGDGKQRRR
jgi:hypothetical protein